jgi:hypothetical protein
VCDFFSFLLNLIKNANIKKKKRVEIMFGWLKNIKHNIYTLQKKRKKKKKEKNWGGFEPPRNNGFGLA